MSIDNVLGGKNRPLEYDFFFVYIKFAQQILALTTCT